MIVDTEQCWTGEREPKVRAMPLGGICICILVGILAAGLWPFHAPRNEVSWLSPGGGLHFGKYGSIVSADTFKADPVQAGNACSIEIWLEPSRSNTGGTILAFYQTAGRVVSFALRQWRGGL